MNPTWLLTTLSHASIGQFSSVLVDTSLKGSVLLALAWLLTRALRRGSAAARHLVWTASLAGLLVIPALSATVPTVRLRVLQPLAVIPRLTTRQSALRPSANPRGESAPLIGMRGPRADDRPGIAAPRSAERSVAAPAAPTPVDFSRVIASIIFMVTALLMLRLALGMLRVSMWMRRAQAVDDGAWLSLAHRLAARLGVSRPVTLLRSDRACVPMTWGVIYPTVLLPSDADEWSHERRTIVLLHELAHVKRFDAMTQLLAQVVVSVFWFNPLVWLAARRMRIEREHACDDFVLAGGARATDYAYDLLQIARALGSTEIPAAALAMARCNELEGRLLSILDPATNHHDVSRSRLALAALSVFALALPLAAFAPAPLAVPVTAPRSAPIHRAFAIARVNDRPPIRIAPVPAPIAAPVASPARRTLPDRETLIAVAQAATKMTSDVEKAELLLGIAKYYEHDDELCSAYLNVVQSMTSDYDRSRTLRPLLLADSLSPISAARVVKTASLMASDNTKATLFINTIENQQTLTSPMRDALIAATATITSDFEHRRTIAAIARRGALSNGQLIGLIASAAAMTSSFEKANALVAISSRQSLADADARKAFLSAAETITSSVDYRRVVTAVLK